MKELKSSVGLGGKPGDGGEEVEDQDFNQPPRYPPVRETGYDFVVVDSIKTLRVVTQCNYYCSWYLIIFITV